MNLNIQKWVNEYKCKSRQEFEQALKEILQNLVLMALSRGGLFEHAAFYGGTALRIFHGSSRFSEDLYFTLLNNDASTGDTVSLSNCSAQATNEQIFEWFKETFEYVLEEAKIRLEIIDPDFHRDKHEHEDGGINFYISYVGPLGGQGNNKKV